MNIGDKWNGWTIESLIGQGTFGKVYRIVREDFSHTYESALKVISIPQNEAEILTFRNEGMSDESITTYYRGMVEEIVSEFVIMSELKGNSNIVSYEDHYYEKKKDAFGWDIYIRMEMLTPLFQYMKDHLYVIHVVDDEMGSAAEKELTPRVLKPVSYPQIIDHFFFTYPFFFMYLTKLVQNASSCSSVASIPASSRAIHAMPLGVILQTISLSLRSVTF